MSKAKSPIETKPLEHCTLKVLLDALASDAMIPGAGAASGVAFALAAACAGKAVAITRRHEDQPALAQLQKQLTELRESGLALGEADALQFKQLLESGGPGPEEKLLRTDCRLLDNCPRIGCASDRARASYCREHAWRLAGGQGAESRQPAHSGNECGRAWGRTEKINYRSFVIDVYIAETAVGGRGCRLATPRKR
ncbi:MAG TPA: cyclodeaminase/cyclohydrolase family protein [Hyphomicrobiales bacterium]|nr:cyclodeaminase/cyclohydrolase family protein [Hyphomicrobiales bacterium]